MKISPQTSGIVKSELLYFVLVTLNVNNIDLFCYLENPQENNKIQPYLIGFTKGVLHEHKVITKDTTLTQMHLELKCYQVSLGSQTTKQQKKTHL